MGRLQDVILRSTRALQPLATAVSIGTLYYVTDEKIMERSTGAAWQSVSDTFTGDSGTGGTKGLVPAPSAGDAAAGKFLKASGAWATGGSWETVQARIVDLSRDNQGGTFTPAVDSSMAVTLGVGVHYIKVICLVYQTTNNSDFRFTLTHSGTVTSVRLMREVWLDSTVSNAGVTSFPSTSVTGNSANQMSRVVFEGQITVSVSGDLQLKWSGDDATATCTLLAGSRIEYKSF